MRRRRAGVAASRRGGAPRHLAVSWLLVATAACVADVASPERERPAPDASAGQVVRGDLRERILLTGELKAERALRLTTPMTRIWQVSVRWMAEDGARVREGDKLVEFDDSAFVGELDEKRLRLKQARSELATERATAAITRADKEFERAKQAVQRDKAALLAGVPRDLMTERDWQERQLALERARVALARAEADLAAHNKASALALEVKEIEVDKIERDLRASEEGMAALTLRAPRSGILLIPEHPWEGRKIEVGDSLQPGWPAAELPDLAAMRVEAHLSDVDDGRVAAGTAARVTLDAVPEQVFDGTVREVAPVAQEMAQQSLRRGFLLRITLARTDPDRMRPGMSVKIEVTGAAVKDALLAPRAGLDLSGEQPVALLPGGERRPIALGPCDAHRCAVASGLALGQELRQGGDR